MEHNNLLKKTGLYLVGNMSSKVLNIFIIPIYAFYIQTEELGYFNYTQTIMNVLIPIIYIAIWEAVLKYLLSENDENIKNVVMSSTTFFTLTISSVFFVIYRIIISLIWPDIKYVWLIILMYISYAISQIWQYMARALGENIIYIIAGLIGTITNLSLIIALVCVFKHGLTGLYIPYILAQVLMIIIIEYKIRALKRLKFKYFDLQILKKMLLFSAPLVLNLISSWAMSGFGSIIITSKLGTKANGMYFFASKFSALIFVIGSVVTMAMIEETITISKISNLNYRFKNIINQLFMVFGVVLLFLMPIVSLFYSTIGNTSYADTLKYVPPLLLFSYFSIMASNIGAALQALDKTNLQFIATLFGAICTLLVSVPLIDNIGIYSVVYGQMIGAFTMMMARYLFVRKYIEMDIDFKTMSKLLVAFCVLSIISISQNSLINVLIITTGGLIIMFKCKKEILEISKYIASKIRYK